MWVVSATIIHRVVRNIAVVINLSAFFFCGPLMGLISGVGLKSIIKKNS
jgi:hypothetical protein